MTRATVSFGAGVAVTPLQMATVYATIANGGTWVQPRLVGGTVGPDGRPSDACPRRRGACCGLDRGRRSPRMLAYVGRGRHRRERPDRRLPGRREDRDGEEDRRAGPVREPLRRLVHRVPARLAAAGRRRGDPGRARRRSTVASPPRRCSSRWRATRSSASASSRPPPVPLPPHVMPSPMSPRRTACTLAVGGPSPARIALAGLAEVVGAEVRGDARRLVGDAAYDSRSVPPGLALLLHPGRDGGRARLRRRRGRGGRRGPRRGAMARPRGAAAAACASVREAMGPMSAALFGHPADGDDDGRRHRHEREDHDRPTCSRPSSARRGSARA